jgi:hypothetical protein
MHMRLLTTLLAAGVATPAFAAVQTFDLAGPDQTGYLSLANVSSGATEAVALTRLPNYPIYETPGGIWTSIVAEPLSADSIYAAELDGFTVLNKTVTESDFATLSAGTVSYDDASLTGVGVETIPASALTIDVNKDGFSPINSPNNNGSGVGNAGWDYVIDVTNLVGAGLTFVDGNLTSAEFDADVSVLPRFGGTDTGAFSTSYDGTLSVTGDAFAFDVDVMQDVGTLFGTLSDTRLVFNRAGSIAAIPEPASLSLLAVGGLLLARRRNNV